ncbi:hypothetical protein R80B4_01590 [Fibrobacteres bacterium R8-0-B4]
MIAISNRKCAKTRLLYIPQLNIAHTPIFLDWLSPRYTSCFVASLLAMTVIASEAKQLVYLAVRQSRVFYTTLHFIWFSIIAIAVAVCLPGCGGGTPDGLVGQWVYFEGNIHDKPQDMELFKTGTAVTDNGRIVTWKADSKRFTIISPQTTNLTAKYKLAGYTLNLVYDDGDTATFVVKEKLGEHKKKISDERLEKISTYFTDSRDGRKYRAVNIGGKRWMAENLNLKTENSWCYYEEDSNCVKFGRLYELETAKAACPSGWHLSNRQEWRDLIAAAGGAVAGKNLKAIFGWYKTGNATDSLGFSAMPGGGINNLGNFVSIGELGSWWIDMGAENYGGQARSKRMFEDKDIVEEHISGSDYGFSVRCVAD